MSSLSSLETQDTSGVIGEMFPTKLYSLNDGDDGGVDAYRFSASESTPKEEYVLETESLNI